MIVASVVVAISLGVIVFQQYMFVRVIERERNAAAADRRELLQRIQDPHTAIAVQAQEELDVAIPRHFVEFDDDADFDVARKMMES